MALGVMFHGRRGNHLEGHLYSSLLEEPDEPPPIVMQASFGGSHNACVDGIDGRYRVSLGKPH